ncbi:MAG: hypothetical protein JWR84_1849 [Caulobacter sp.]|nr:hypothetical protein [Caulobacter sp.]
MATDEQRPGSADGQVFWSITVEVTNNAGQDLLLDPAMTNPPLSWLGSPPEWGSTLQQGRSMSFGAVVDTPTAGVEMYLGFAADGRPPVTVNASVGPDSQPSCVVNPGQVQGTATLLSTDPTHAQYAVELNP